jgi:hypothetical protein
MTVTDTKFFQEGDARDYRTELVIAYGEDIALTRHHGAGNSLLVHTEPSVDEGGRPYGVCTVLIPGDSARLTHNGIATAGSP